MRRFGRYKVYPGMRLARLLACLIVLPAISMQAQLGQARLSKKVSPLQVSLIENTGRQLKVRIKNCSSVHIERGSPVALRGVYCQERGTDTRKWLDKEWGNLYESQADYDSGKEQRISLDRPFHLYTPIGPNSPPTQILFEKGVILPGQCRDVAVQAAGQKDRNCRLVVRYAVVGKSENWHDQIFVPVEVQDPVPAADGRPGSADKAPSLQGYTHCHDIFYPFSDLSKRRLFEEYQARHKDYSAVVRATAFPGKPSLPVHTEIFNLR